MANLFGDSDQVALAGVKGEFKGEGGGTGVEGVSVNGNGVRGTSTANHGVHGESTTGRGVHGIGHKFIGVSGVSTDGVGVSGESTSEVGVLGKSTSSFGVRGISETNHGVHGESAQGRGVLGTSPKFVGVTGESNSHDGVFGTSVSGIGVHGKGGRLAGLFEGDMEVTGSIAAGNLNVHGRDIFQALQKIDSLEKQVQQLRQQVDAGPTSFGEPVNIPRTRPNISSVRDIGSVGGDRIFEVEGNGFALKAPIVVRFFNRTSTEFNSHDPGLDNPGFPPRHSTFSDGNGAFIIPNTVVPCRRGDTLHVAASDRSVDRNDQSGILWSTVEKVVVK